MDTTFAMGHVVIRRKTTIVGDESPDVILFRCIQNMNPVYPFNTCYTGGELLFFMSSSTCVCVLWLHAGYIFVSSGIVELKVGDHLELLIPRSSANVSLDGDSTFLGAVKLT